MNKATTEQTTDPKGVNSSFNQGPGTNETEVNPVKLPPKPRGTSPFPKRFSKAFDLFFGQIEIDRNTGKPSRSWEGVYLSRMPLPYAMRLAVMPEVVLNHCTIHTEVESSLVKIFHEILEKMGPEGIRDAGADFIGETYAFRAREGSAELSMHAYGAAITIDPARNLYGEPYDPEKGMIHPDVVRAFESNGWLWGGRFETPHCAYFEATGGQA